VSFLSLYKSIDAANVLSHFVHDGMVKLGEARLPGTVSAWTFLVERSNGEALGSVNWQPDTSGTGLFVSLALVELRTVIQTTGVTSLVLRKQSVEDKCRRLIGLIALKRGS
jgi:hypothetical protein